MEWLDIIQGPVD